MENINEFAVLSITPHTPSIHHLPKVDEAEEARKRHLQKIRQRRYRARQRLESPSTSLHQAQLNNQKTFEEFDLKFTHNSVNQSCIPPPITNEDSIIKEDNPQINFNQLENIQDGSTRNVNGDNGEPLQMIEAMSEEETRKKRENDNIPNVNGESEEQQLPMETSLTNDVNEYINIEASQSNDVDRFKRRLIRAIARMMLVEKIPEDTMWENLQKDTGCDCKMLWIRMRTLTLKKLKRLISAEDRLDGVTKIARLSVTDWLLFDLVLVHEKVDVIGQLSINEVASGTLHELFELVQKYKIESQTGSSLARAWVQLTSEYNKCGRQCTPMLLQLRWYQLKELTRKKFYDFWFAYRGAATRLPKAKENQPCELLQAIARKYGDVVTQKFSEWEELVRTKRVFVREDFESLGDDEEDNQSNADVLIIEPVVETIDLDGDSDTEQSTTSVQSQTSKEQNLDVCRVKRETLDNPMNECLTKQEIGLLESTHIPLEQSNMCNPGATKSPAKILCVSVTGSTYNNNEPTNANVLPRITSVTGAVNFIDDDDIESDKHLHLLANKPEGNNTNKVLVNAALKIKDSGTVNNNKDTLPSTSSNTIDAVHDKKDYEVELDDLIILEEGIALDEEEDIKDLPRYIQHEAKTVEIEKKESNGKEGNRKFDFKLLLTPVVYSKKLDEMVVFKFKDFRHVRDRRTIERSSIESKPKTKAVNVEKLTEDIKNQLEFDLSDSEKTLGRMGKDNTNSDAQDTKDDTNLNAQDTKDDGTLKISSWLFQKPKIRTYNSIKLCKNPDFNTRLKRLTSGFLSCENNRNMLKKCKPLTIDLHKSFERELDDNKTLHLISEMFANVMPITADPPSNILRADSVGSKHIGVIEKEITDISPTEVIDELVRIKDEQTLSSEQDNSKNSGVIFQSNKKLLTVEITPIKANNVNYTPPVEIVNDNDKNDYVTSIEQTVIKSSTLTLDNVDVDNNQFQSVPKGVIDNLNFTRSSNEDQMKVSKRNFYHKINKFSKYASRKSTVAWHPLQKNTSLYGGDILLASDTLEKMLRVLSNDVILDLPKKQKRKIRSDCKKKPQDNNTGLKKRRNRRSALSIDVNSTGKPLDKHEITNKLLASKACKRYTRKKPIQKSLHCCWAQEKFVTKQEPKVKHSCPHPICICCCRDRLLKQSLQRLPEDINETSTSVSTDIADSINVLKKTETSESIPELDTRKSTNMVSNNMLNDESIIVSDDEVAESRNFSQSTDDLSNINVVNVISLSEDSKQPVDTIKSSENCREHIESSQTLQEISEMKISKTITEMSISKPATLVTDNNFINVQQISEHPSIALNVNSDTDSFDHHNIQVDDFDTTNLLSNNVIDQPQEKALETSQDNVFNFAFGRAENSNSMFCKTRVWAGNTYPTITVTDLNSLTNPKTSHVKVVTPKGDSMPVNSNVVKKMSKTPIYLGKNKILLCRERNTPKTIIDVQSILPPGVNVTLLPSGVVEIHTNPGISLNDDELSNIYNILSQLPTKSNLCNENIDNQSLTEVKYKILGNGEDNLKKTQGTKISASPLVADDVANKTDAENEEEISKKNESVHLDREHKNQTEKLLKIDNVELSRYDEVTNEKNKNKSILSDLMEMSGISENDTLCDEKIQQNLEISAPSTTVKSPKLNSKISNVDVLRNRNDLVIVWSFSELKKYHDKSFEFYKMDTETGEIVPINLKIKKKDNSLLLPRPSLKSVIDLTDDLETDLDDGDVPTQPETIKISPSVSKLTQGKRNLKYLVKRQLVARTLKRKKPVIIRKIQMPNNSSKNISNTTCNMDTDSDDEPLAKKALRKLNVEAVDTKSTSMSGEVLCRQKDVNDEIDTEELLEPEIVNNVLEEDCILGV